MPVDTQPQSPVTVRMFAQRFSSTRLGARLARHLALHRLDDWGIPYDTDPSDAAAVIVAELAANAVTHGRVPGRDFELRLTLSADTLRIEVSDARTEKRPKEVLPDGESDAVYAWSRRSPSGGACTIAYPSGRPYERSSRCRAELAANLWPELDCVH